MYRYVAVLWDPTDESASLAARFAAGRLHHSSHDWDLVVDSDGLIAFHSGLAQGSCETRVLSDAAALFGRVFKSGREYEPVRAAARFELEESHRIIVSRGAHLIDHYWGRYVAIARDPVRNEAFILRDPTGGLPCFIAPWRNTTLVFSDIEACVDLGLLSFSINWKYIAAFVPYSALQIRDTGLDEVSEVQAGERVTLKGKHVERTLIWNPIEIAARGAIENVDQAVEQIRQKVHTCVHAWASLHRCVIHNLSGGLDSSIVLSSLKVAATQPDVVCLHHYSPSTSEDERPYARLMANHAQVELVEVALDPANVRLERLEQIRRTPKPWFYVYDLLYSSVEARVAADNKATGFFSGSGGDGLFLQARADLAVADYLRRHGFSPGVIKVALDAARITRTSLWPLLAEGLRRHLRRASPDPLGEHADARSLIPTAVFEAARNNDDLIHPWIASARGIAPGLLWQVLCLSVPPVYYESFGGESDLERTPVLMSQPLIELCLQIPSYVWITGGRDRAVARRAFATGLPPQIVRRHGKGAIDQANLVICDANEPYLREILLDGLLVREGLLDRAKLESYLARGASRADYEYNDVLRHHLCTEVWLRRWSQTRQRAAA